MALFDSDSARRALQVKAGKASRRAMVAKLGEDYFKEWARTHGPGRSVDGRVVKKGDRKHETSRLVSPDDGNHSEQRSGDKEPA